MSSGAAPQYYVGICGSVTTVDCADGGDSHPIAIQTWFNPPKPHFPSTNCATLGAFSTQACVHTPGADDPLAGDLVCSYTKGADERAIDVRFASGAAQSQMQTTATQLETLKYQVTVTDPTLCMLPPPQVVSSGLTWGSYFLIFFFFTGAVYVGGGAYYNVKYNQKELGVAAVPQIEYWEKVPGLVRDGAIFTMKHTKRAAKMAHDKWRGAGPDKTQGLIDPADEGADDEQ